MSRSTATTERSSYRRAFEAWSIEVPDAFREQFVMDEGCYWMAFDAHRSVSLTSIVVTAEDGPPKASQILERSGQLDGEPIDALPAGQLGHATTSAAPIGSVASRLLQGVLALDGRVLLVTITSDDIEWALRVWLSIRDHPASPEANTVEVLPIRQPRWRSRVPGYPRRH